MKITNHRTQLNGQQISFTHKKGDGSLPTLFFLHGWGSNKEIFRSLQQVLPAESFALDLPGFGDSPAPQAAAAVSDYQNLVQAFIKTSGSDRVVLVGHSFGGQIATAIAGENPTWLTGLILISAASLRQKQPPFLSRIARVFSPLFSLPGIARLRPALYKLLGADLPPENPVMQETMRTILREDQRVVLPHISCPTLLVWGRADSSTPLSEGEEIAVEIPQAELEALPGGHFAFLEQKTRTADTILSFIQKN